MNQFEPAHYPPEVLAKYPPEQQARLLLAHLFINDTYQVAVTDHGSVYGLLKHMSIKRLDREPIHDWRELQQIKNMLFSPEHEAVELYPAESRLVDTANQYHLWVLADVDLKFDFGYENRLVIDHDEPHPLRSVCDAVKQRPMTDPMYGVIEPSDPERATWSPLTVAYVEALEELWLQNSQ